MRIEQVLLVPMHQCVCLLVSLLSCKCTLRPLFGVHAHKTSSSSLTRCTGSLNVTAVCDKIAGDTEDKYTIDFWEGLNVVVSALDNVQARQYIDSKCVQVGWQDVHGWEGGGAWQMAYVVGAGG